MLSGQELWQSVLSQVEERVSKQQFDTWFRPLKLLEGGGAQLQIGVPNNFFREWISNRYLPVLREACEQAAGRPLGLELVVDESGWATAPEEPPRRPARSHPRNYQVAETQIRLNQRYTFPNFVVGPCNNLAHAASLAVATAPSQGYNPLFLHGSVGLGKTHLIQAIAHELLQRRPPLKVGYMSCEDFMNQFIFAVQHGQIDNFRFRYRHLDALLIDDIHFLAKGERTQEEFFHTFNTLYNAGKQIVLSSDSPPKELPKLEERLVSRFKWGLVARLDRPEFETRVAILQEKARFQGYELPQEVAEFVANVVDTNIRELEGAATRVIGYSRLKREPVGLPLAREALRDIREEASKTVSIEDIQKAVVGHFRLRISDLQSKKRSQSLVFPRQIGMYLTRRLTRHSLEETGGYFGGRDHTTVLHACEKIEKCLKEDPDLVLLLDRLTRDLTRS